MTDNDTEYIRQTEATRVRVLSEALPYIQQFAGRTVVVKYGGAAMKDSALKDQSHPRHCILILRRFATNSSTRRWPRN